MSKPLPSSQKVPWWVFTIMAVGAIESFYLAGVNKPFWSIVWTGLWFVAALAGLKVYRRSLRRPLIEPPTAPRGPLPGKVVPGPYAVPAQMVRQDRPAVGMKARQLPAQRQELPSTPVRQP